MHLITATSTSVETLILLLLSLTAQSWFVLRKLFARETCSSLKLSSQFALTMATNSQKALRSVAGGKMRIPNEAPNCFFSTARSRRRFRFLKNAFFDFSCRSLNVDADEDVSICYVGEFNEKSNGQTAFNAVRK